MVDNNSLEEKLSYLLKNFQSILTLIEDDTILQKLYSYLHEIFKTKRDAMSWCQEVKLLDFIDEALQKEFVVKNHNALCVSFALNCLSFLASNENHFKFMIQNKIVMENYIKSLPTFQAKFSHISNALKVTNSLVGHTTGLAWLIDNGVWEKLFISSLTSQSIFVRKECIKIIGNFLFNIENEEVFSGCMGDLNLVLYKVRERKYELIHVTEDEESHVDEAEEAGVAAAKLQFSTETIILIFYEILNRTLGKKCFPSYQHTLMGLSADVLERFNCALPDRSAIGLSKILLLNILHRFQQKVFSKGLAEPKHLNAMVRDVLSLTSHMMEKGHRTLYLRGSLDIHKMWHVLQANLASSSKKIDISNCDSVVFLLLKYQLVALRVTCCSSLDMGSDQEQRLFEENYHSWRNKFLAKMNFHEDLKTEMLRLETELFEALKGDPKAAKDLSVSMLSHWSGMIQYLHPTCASMLFQMLLFVLKFKTQCTSALDLNPRFYLCAIDVFRALIERYQFDWHNCYESASLLPVLCSIIWIPGNTTRIKVSTLQTISTCISKFIPPVMDPLMGDPKHKDSAESYFEKLGQTLTLYLSDTEWEVRDSALELIRTCMNVHNEQQPSFVRWFHRFDWGSFALQALGDSESFVAASAGLVIASVISVEEIWSLMDAHSVKQKALRASVEAGDAGVRRMGLTLVKALLQHAKFDEKEERFVVAVVRLAVDDCDDLVRCGAVALAQTHLRTQLSRAGMMDDSFPHITFQAGKIVLFNAEEVKKRVLAVVLKFCRNGYFSSISRCVDDLATDVSVAATEVLRTIASLVKMYNLKPNILEELEEPTTTKDKKMEDCSTDCVPSSVPVATSDAALDEVLQTSDLAAIYKLKKHYSEPHVGHWWYSEESSDLLMPQSLPPEAFPVSVSYVFQYLEKINERQNNDDPNSQNDTKSIEHDFSLLLDDIFLVLNTSKQNEDCKNMDCY